VLARVLLAAPPAVYRLLSLPTGSTARELATELMARAEEKRAATASAPPLCCVCMYVEERGGMRPRAAAYGAALAMASGRATT
jgi:hypothetical protein